jgi:hypothetical protein
MAPATATFQGMARRQELRGLKRARNKGFKEFVSFCLVGMYQSSFGIKQ